MIKKILVSLVLIASAVLLFVVAAKSKSRLNDPAYTKTQATIVDIEVSGTSDNRSHTVYVEYDLNGTAKKAELNTYSSNMRIGDSVEILYDAGSPTFVYTTSPAGPRIMTILGIVCIVLGVLFPFSKKGFTTSRSFRI